MKTQLFIEGYEVELDKSVQFAITKQFEDLSSPTDICNDWSKTVSIPFTMRNNKLFSELYRNDSIIDTVEFSPFKKLDFKLIFNESLLMHGYCKINSITKKNGKGTYNINLFGKLGEVFGELQKITTIKENVEDDKYYIGDIAPMVINKETVYNSWNKSNYQYEYNDNTPSSEIIGFSCSNQGYNDKFDSAIYQDSKDTTKEFKQTLDDKINQQKWNITADALLGDGLKPRQYGEFRSYHQVPFIPVPKMFQILKKKCDDITDYTLELDNSWFNQNNPYYAKQVMTLNRPVLDEDIFATLNTLDERLNNLIYTNNYFYNIEPLNRYNSNWDNMIADCGNTKVLNILRNTDTDVNGKVYESEESYPICNYDTDTFSKSVATMGKFHFTGRLLIGALLKDFIYNDTYVNLTVDDIAMGTTNGFIITYYVGDRQIRKSLVCMPDSTISKVGYDNVINPYDGLSSIQITNKVYPSGHNQVGLRLLIYDPFNVYVPLSGDFQMKIKVETVNNTSMFTWKSVNGSVPSGFPKSAGWYGNSSFLFNSFGNSRFTLLLSSKVHSGSYIDLHSVWDSKKTLFEQCLKYSKMYNLIWRVDETSKKIICEPRFNYFKDYTIEDWTDKVDFSKDFEITPLIFDNKYYKFNYSENESKLNEMYSNKYGMNFGELKINTNYNFSSASKDLFKDVLNSIPNTETILDWNTMINNGNAIKFISTNEIMPNFETSDGKQGNSFGQFYFFKGTKTFDSNLIDVCISDDSYKQLDENKYYYLDKDYGFDNNYLIRATFYPVLDVNYENHLNLFNKPNICFCYGTSYDNAESLYSVVWKNYIEGELLNKQVHKLTCYIRITPVMYNDFRFNRFVTVNNVLYFVNKIFDYEISNLTTKCELIKVNSIDNYVKSGAASLVSSITYDGNPKFYLSGNAESEWHSLVYASSIYDITFDDDSKQKLLPNGITIKIVKETADRYCIYYQKTNTYSSGDDYEVVVKVKNMYVDNNELTIIRYSDYPYPPVINVYPSTIEHGTGTFTIELRTQHKPKSVSFSGSNGCTFTLGEWEEFNDDYYGYRVDCSYNNQSYASKPTEIGTYPVTVAVRTGTDYYANATINVKRIFKQPDSEIIA